MEPRLQSVSDEGDLLRFTLQDINVSFANAIRRTLLTDIPVIAIRTETYDTNQCRIHTNTGRLHNEILKQRISCIPINSKKLQDDEDGKTLHLFPSVLQTSHIDPSQDTWVILTCDARCYFNSFGNVEDSDL